MSRLLAVFGSVLWLVQSWAVGSVAHAAYPAQPIKLVVAYSAGGGTDTTARIVAERMSRIFGQSVVVDNRPGAAGTIGANAVAKAAPDGYTLLFASAPELSVASVGIKNLAYDPVKDFRPISLIGHVRFVLVANKDFEADSVAELISYAQANPGKVSFASFGSFTSNHLVGELFGARAGIDILHVPYKGSAPALIDLMGGRVQISFDSMPNVMPLIESGKIKPLAIATASRSQLLPEVPTMTESGVPDFIASTWFGLLAPQGTPDEIVDKLREVVSQVLDDAETQSRFASRHIEPQGSTPEEFSGFIASEKKKWEDLAEKIGLHAQ
ncbi:MAG: tripartite tricarboxylate transporter substrate binding protein [Pusillimonas sp.]